MGEVKKPTKGDMERRLRTAIVLVPKDKDYKAVHFDDKGLRLEVTQDFAVITTGFHRHVFNNLTAQGVSRPYLYVKRFIDMALENDCTVKDAKGNVTRSYGKLLAVLKEKEDQKDFQMAWYIDLWLNNIFHPLYGIGETVSESFLVYESYLHNLARNKVILSEKINGMTNKQFIDEVIDNIKKMTDGIDERIVFEAKSDEEKAKEEIDAIQQHQAERVAEEGGRHDDQQS